MRTDPFLIIEHGGGCCNPSAEDEQGREVLGFQSHSLAETGFSLVIVYVSKLKVGYHGGRYLELTPGLRTHIHTHTAHRSFV